MSSVPSRSSSERRPGTFSITLTSMPGCCSRKSFRNPTKRSGPIVHITPRMSGAASSLRKLCAANLGRISLSQHLLQMRTHQAPEIRHPNLIALAVEQVPGELGLELLDGAGQGRLRHVTELCSAVEIQGSARREKILDLVHLHVRLHPDNRRASK